MKTNVDKDLKAVISLLRGLSADGTMEQGRKEAIEKAINNLRRANRRHDPAKLRAAVGHVARLFLRSQCR